MGQQDNHSSPPPPQAACSQLKHFLSSPPPFEMMAEVSTRIPEGTGQEMSTVCVLLRWQPNAFYYHEAPKVLDLASTNHFPGCRLAGYYGDDAWDFSLDGVTLSSAATADSSIRKSVELLMAVKASPLLHLGIFGCLPGAVAWDNDRIRPLTNYFGVAIEGGLVVSNSVLQGLRLQATHLGHLIPWEIAYDFSASKSLPAFIPGRIVGISSSSGRRLLNFEIRLLSLNFRNAPMPPECFAPASFSRTYEVVSAANRKQFRGPLNKSLAPVVSLPASQHPTHGRFRATFLLANLVILLAALFFAWRRKSPTINHDKRNQ